MPNRLAHETSPYLLQHKDNPVDWYAWGEDAFADAKASGRPVLLSVGYSACHWCHVMAHESFENPEIAALMNRLFVNIKVDREERPDIDNIYMQAVQSLTGRGGWPMTVFLTDEGVPFYGGTYYPPEDRQGMPGFPRLLSAVSEAYRDKRQQLEISGHELLTQIGSPARLQAADNLLTESILHDSADAILARHDDDLGGFGRAPKFPQAMTIDFLLRYHHSSKKARPLEAAEITLKAMARGGMYDQAGGGFHRYSTDDVWLVPHFEKMLYDNALLARAYLDAYKVTGDPMYRRITEETLDYVLREMTDPSGGFYSAQDADSAGEEGKFFVWTPPELVEVLGADDVKTVADYYGVTDAGNFEGANILHVRKPGDDAFEVRLEPIKAKLYDARERRIHPGLDDKVLTAWNGLMQKAFAEAAIAFDSQRYRTAAVNNADFLLSQMRPNGRVLRTWKHVLSRAAGEGVARINGYLEDYACLIDALISTHAATFELRYLQSAIELAQEMIDLFWDEEVQGFFDTGKDHETLITRPRDFFDNATPSGTSVAIDALLRLAVLTDNDDFEHRAVTCLRTLTPFIEQAPTAFGRLLAALEFYLARSLELAIVAPPGSPLDALLGPIRLLYAPNLLLVGAPEGTGAEVSPLLQDRPARDGQPTAYVCERFVCQAPTTEPAELLSQLRTLMP